MSKGCYQCGSEEGSEVVLCPKCRQERRQRSDAINEVKRPGEPEAEPEEAPPQVKLDRKTAVGIAWGIIIVGFIGYRLIASGNELTPDHAYDRCMEKFQEATEKAKADIAKDAGTGPAAEVGAGFGQMIAGVMGGLSEAACKTLKDECEKDLESAACQDAWKAFQK